MGKLTVAGIGAGSEGQMTLECRRALEDADVIVGYTVYVDLVRDLLPGKEYVSTPMMREVERCKAALELAAGEKNVCMVCSGDAGVYGMASLVLELAGGYPVVEVEVLPGVTAACAGAALLGAPISHDFAVISLSDLLTPWELIERRLRAAAMGDFAVCLYNPSSRRRADYLQKACDILMEERSGETACGVARNIGRAGESGDIMTLAELRNTAVDMFSTVFIGSSQTRIIDGKLVTPRGYRGV